jgi:hypothetical protein
MDGERLGRVVAVTLLALLTPVACAAAGLGTPVASGLPPSPGSASPAVQLGDGVEATTAETFHDQHAADRTLGSPVSHQSRRYASSARVRVIVPFEKTWSSTTTTALGPATSTPEATPVAMRYLRSR